MSTDCPPLAASTIQVLTDRVKKNALSACSDHARVYADCAKEYPYQGVVYCQGPLANLNNCVKEHTKQEFFDREVERFWEEREKRDKQRYEEELSKSLPRN
jgi:hypothetical protein